ncbi:MAG: NUDIX hydrolase [Gemmatimonadaceae bacterium]|nr:NUDIX hydrolase [Gemmatimonadaceae bacterium]
MTAGKHDGATISVHQIHAGRIIRVNEETIRFPDGTIGHLDIVRHPGACAVLPVLSSATEPDPDLLLLRQYRHAAAEWLVEIPAGRKEAGEPPEQCARRELLEETGCAADELTLLTTILTTPGFSDEIIHLFMATGLTMGESRRESDEFIEVVPTRLSRALGMIERGDIHDAKSATAILYAAQFRLLGHA